MAIHAAGELRVAAAVPSLVTLLRDPRCPDRDAAARALGEIGDGRALEALREARDDPDPDVAEEARAAVESIDARRGVLTGSAGDG